MNISAHTTSSTLAVETRTDSVCLKLELDGGGMLAAAEAMKKRIEGFALLAARTQWNRIYRQHLEG